MVTSVSREPASSIFKMFFCNVEATYTTTKCLTPQYHNQSETKLFLHSLVKHPVYCHHTCFKYQNSVSVNVIFEEQFIIDSVETQQRSSFYQEMILSTQHGIRVVTPMLLVREVQGSNLGPEAGYRERLFVVFLRPFSKCSDRTLN
jgi:hypothetical protein